MFDLYTNCIFTCMTDFSTCSIYLCSLAFFDDNFFSIELATEAKYFTDQELNLELSNPLFFSHFLSFISPHAPLSIRQFIFFLWPQAMNNYGNLIHPYCVSVSCIQEVNLTERGLVTIPLVCRDPLGLFPLSSTHPNSYNAVPYHKCFLIIPNDTKLHIQILMNIWMELYYTVAACVLQTGVPTIRLL